MGIAHQSHASKNSGEQKPLVASSIRPTAQGEPKVFDIFRRICDHSGGQVVSPDPLARC